MSDKNRRAAIVMFVEVHDESADAIDAAHRAEYGLKAALAGEASVEFSDWKWHIGVKNQDSKHVPCDVNLTVHEVMEVGMAAGNGYLWTDITSKAYPRKGDDDD